MSKTSHIKPKRKLEKNVYNRIKSALAEKQKTNIELADDLNVTVETISSWCTNSAQPSVKSLFRIALFLNVNPGSLLVKLSDFNNASNNTVEEKNNRKL